MKTLDEIRKSPKEWLTPTDVSDFLEVKPYSINVQAGQNPDKLGFPVTVVGSRVKINKNLFVMYFSGELIKKKGCVT